MEFWSRFIESSLDLITRARCGESSPITMTRNILDLLLRGKHLPRTFGRPEEGSPLSFSTIDKIKDFVSNSPSNSVSDCETPQQRVSAEHCDLVDLEFHLLSTVIALGICDREQNGGSTQDLLLDCLVRQRQVAQTSRRPPIKLRRTTPNLVLLDEPSSQEQAGISKQWQGRLCAELNTYTSNCRDTVVRLVARTCEDLEQRCETVETPLRKEEEIRRVSEKKCSELETRVVYLEKAKARSKELAAEADQEQVRIRRELEQVSEELNAKDQEVERLKREVRENAEASELNLDELRQSKESEVKSLRSTLAQREGAIHQKETENNDLQDRIEFQNQATIDKRSETDKIESELTESLQRNQEELQIYKKSLEEKDDEIKGLRSGTNDLNSQVLDLDQQVKDANSCLSELRDEIERLKQTHDQGERDLVHQHEEKITQLHEGASRRQIALQDKAEALETSLEEAHQTYESQLKKRDRNILSLERKTKSLSEEVRKKTEKLNEAHQMKAKLLSAMGMKTGQDPSEGEATVLQDDQQWDEIEEVPQSSPFDTRDHDMLTEAGSGLQEKTRASFGSGSSSSISGPTPKRPRPRKLSRAQSAQHGTSSKPVRSHRRGTQSMSESNLLKETNANGMNIRAGKKLPYRQTLGAFKPSHAVKTPSRPSLAALRSSGVENYAEEVGQDDVERRKPQGGMYVDDLRSED